jgi:tRNA 2-selenouridine synthase
MVPSLACFDPEVLDRFDAIIDVRSPAEFALDHVPGAVNLPVLGDAERAEVGAIYVQVSRLKARILGAAIVARNIARHLEGPLAEKPGAFAPLIYCWRGGQRSAAMAEVLSQVGWRPTVLAGGYKTYRRWVRERLYQGEAAPAVILLAGDTGSAKTEILRGLSALGVQSLDLEALAQHRGSLFGALPGRPQPSQKLFESRLAWALDRLDRSRAVVVEAESSKIGDLVVPPSLWKAMAAAPRIELRAPAPARARYLIEAYGDVVADRTRLSSIIASLPVHHARKTREAWLALAAAGAFEALALALIQDHYDPAYRRAIATEARETLGVVALDDLGLGDRRRAVEEVAALVRPWRPRS